MSVLRFGLAVLLVVTACKRPEGSDVKVYEQEQYLDKNICELMKQEALEKAKTGDIDPLAAYLPIVRRESEIFDQLVPKATECIEKRAAQAKPQEQAKAQDQTPQTAAATKPLDPQQGQTQVAGNNATTPDPALESSPETTFALAEGNAGTVVKSDVGTECEGLDEARLDIYKKKISDISACRELKPEDVPKELLRGKSSLCRNTAGTLPSWVDETCNVSEDAMATLGKGAIEQGCDMIAELMKSQTPGKFDSAGSIACGAEVVKHMCAQYGKAGIDGIVLADKEKEGKANDGLVIFSRAQVKVFIGAVAGCVQAYGAEKVKEAVADGIVQGAGRTLFSAAIDGAEKNLKELDKHRIAKAVLAAACKITTNVVATQLEKTPKKVYTDSCSAEAQGFDKQQAAACMRTTGDACEIALTGKVDLGAIAGLSEGEAEKMIADIASAGVEALCAAGGKVSTVACGTLSKSAQYIKDAILEGKSNPWAECLGTTKVGACVGQRLWEWSAGYSVKDMQQTNPGLEKPTPEAPFYEMDICWCAVNCWRSIDWAYDTKIEGTYVNRWFAEVNANICAAKNRTNPQALTTPYRVDGYPIYEIISSCDIVKARSKNTNFGGTEESNILNIDVYWKDKWQSVTFGQDRYCGGLGRQ